MSRNDSEKFNKRFEQLPKLPDYATFTISKARYAKDKVAISFHSDGSGWKNYANLLFNEVTKAGHRQYSGREKAYIVSISKVEKFLKAWFSNN